MTYQHPNGARIGPTTIATNSPRADDTPNPATLPAMLRHYADEIEGEIVKWGLPVGCETDCACPVMRDAATSIDQLQADLKEVRELSLWRKSEMERLAAEVERLKAEKQEQALQALSDDGQWIEHTGKLQAEVERLRKDAGRYQWLRSGIVSRQGRALGDRIHREINKSRYSALLTFRAWCEPDELDAAMDAAMSSLPGEREKT